MFHKLTNCHPVPLSFASVFCWVVISFSVFLLSFSHFSSCCFHLLQTLFPRTVNSVTLTVNALASHCTWSLHGYLVPAIVVRWHFPHVVCTNQFLPTTRGGTLNNQQPNQGIYTQINFKSCSTLLHNCCIQCHLSHIVISLSNSLIKCFWHELTMNIVYLCKMLWIVIKKYWYYCILLIHSETTNTINTSLSLIVLLVTIYYWRIVTVNFSLKSARLSNIFYCNNRYITFLNLVIKQNVVQPVIQHTLDLQCV